MSEYDVSADPGAGDHPWDGAGYDVDVIEQPDGSTMYIIDTDHDGVPNAIAFDTDGDGDIENVLMDGDGNGSLDTLAVDTDDDGSQDEYYEAA
jgi:hypothetical protein